MCLIVFLAQKIVSLYDQSDQIINFYVGLSNCLFCADTSCIPSIVEFGKKVSCMPIFLLIALVCFYCLFFNIVVLFTFFLLLPCFFLCILMLTPAYCCTILSYQFETVVIFQASILLYYHQS